MQHNDTAQNGLFQIIKAVGFALAISLLYAVIFATVLRAIPISDKAIYPINQTAKQLFIFISAFLFIKGDKGFLKGIAVGLIFTALSYLTFSSLGGDFSLSWLLIIEVVLSTATGLLGGVLAVNCKRN